MQMPHMSNRSCTLGNGNSEARFASSFTYNVTERSVRVACLDVGSLGLTVEEEGRHIPLGLAWVLLGLAAPLLGRRHFNFDVFFLNGALVAFVLVGVGITHF